MAGGLAAAGGGAAGGAAGGVAQTVVFDAATRAAVGGPGGSVPGGVSKPARSMGSKVAFAVAAAVVVGVVGTTAVVALGNDDPKDSAANITDPDGDAKDADASPTPTVDPVVDTVPSGRWNFRSVVIRSSDPDWAKVGTKETAAWRLRADCASASSCAGVVKSSSGVDKGYSWSGTVLRVVREASEGDSGCVNVNTGEAAPGGKIFYSNKGSVARMRLVAGTAEDPRRLEGRLVVTTTVKRWVNCPNLIAKAKEPKVVVYRTTLTPKR